MSPVLYLALVRGCWPTFLLNQSDKHQGCLNRATIAAQTGLWREGRLGGGWEEGWEEWWEEGWEEGWKEGWEEGCWSKCRTHPAQNFVTCFFSFVIISCSRGVCCRVVGVAGWWQASACWVTLSCAPEVACDGLHGNPNKKRVFLQQKGDVYLFVSLLLTVRAVASLIRKQQTVL